MNLFWKRLFGKLRPTDQFERDMQRLKDDIRRASQAEEPAEMTESVKTWRAFSEAFADDFNYNTLTTPDWSFGFHYGDPALIGEHSYTDEWQANNSGRNTTVSHSTLRIATRKEHVQTRAWDTAKGFVKKDFDYTADVVQSAGGLRRQGGVFQVKMRCTGKVNHACWLGGDGKLPLVKLMHFDGKTLRMGSMDARGRNEARVKGLRPDRYHVYTLIWSAHELVWLINNVEVHRTTTQVPQEALYLAFNSFLPRTARPAEGTLEVDWVRVYTN